MASGRPVHDFGPEPPRRGRPQNELNMPLATTPPVTAPTTAPAIVNVRVRECDCARSEPAVNASSSAARIRRRSKAGMGHPVAVWFGRQYYLPGVPLANIQ